MGSLLRRGSSFANLALVEIEESHNDNFRRLLKAEAVNMLELERTTSRQIQQLLSTSVKGVGFSIKVEDLLGLDWRTVEIIPKELSVKFPRCDSEAHVKFITSLLRRLAELGNFVKLEIALDHEFDMVMPSRVADELNHALLVNQSMTELCICGAFSHFDERLADIFATLELHEGLRRLKVDFFPKDAGYPLLKRSLKRNRHIELTNYNGDRLTDGFEIDRLCEFNRFARNCQSRCRCFWARC